MKFVFKSKPTARGEGPQAHEDDDFWRAHNAHLIRFGQGRKPTVKLYPSFPTYLKLGGVPPLNTRTQYGL